MYKLEMLWSSPLGANRGIARILTLGGGAEANIIICVVTEIE
jgi:hypothetical protein